MKIRSLNMFAGNLAYATSGSAGLDLVAIVEDGAQILKAGKRMVIPTGIALELDEGYEAQIRSRSGLAAEHGIVVLNSPATIDADYTGEVKVILANFGEKNFIVHTGMRIAQLVLARVERFEGVTVLSRKRGSSGFGSTGV